MQLLARFATEGGRVTSNGAKSKLFEPNRHLLLSVFFIDELDKDSVVEIGLWVLLKKAEREPERKKWRLHGWAELSTDGIRKLGLDIISDQRDHERHANIVQWPADHSRRLLLQQELVLISIPVRLDNTVTFSPDS